MRVRRLAFPFRVLCACGEGEVDLRESRGHGAAGAWEARRHLRPDTGPHVGNLPRERMRVWARQPACRRWWVRPT